MEEQEKSSEARPDEIPKGQRYFDRIFLLLILSILISGLFYNVWGLIELFIVR